MQDDRQIYCMFKDNSYFAPRCLHEGVLVSIYIFFIGRKESFFILNMRMNT